MIATNGEELARALCDAASAAEQDQLLADHLLVVDREYLHATARALHARFIDLFDSLNDARQVAALGQKIADATEHGLHAALAIHMRGLLTWIADGDPTGGSADLEEAASLYEQHGDVMDLARLNGARCLVLQRIGRRDEARQVASQAEGVLEQAGEYDRLVTLYGNWSAMLVQDGDFSAALDLLDRANAMTREHSLGSDRRIHIALNRGYCLVQCGDYKQAVELLEETCRAALAAESQDDVCAARLNLGRALVGIGDYSRAFVELDRSTELAMKIQHQELAALAALSSTDCLILLRRFREAVERCRQVRDQLTAVGARLEAGQATYNEALAHMGLRELSSAQDAATIALSTFTEERNDFWQAATESLLAEILLRHGHAQEALELARHSLERIRGQADADAFEAEGARILFARAAIAMGDLGTAGETIAGIVVRARRDDNPTWLHQAWLLRGQIAEAENRVEQAIACYVRAAEALERVEAAIAIELRSSFLEDKTSVYERLVDVSLHQGKIEEALGFVERAKSRALLALSSAPGALRLHAQSAVDQPFVDAIVSLRSERDGLRAQLQRARAGEDQHVDRQALAAELLNTEKKLESQWHRLLHRNEVYARDRDRWLPDLAMPQPYLDAEQALIEYFTVDDEILAFVVVHDEVQLRRLGVRPSKIRSLLQRLRLGNRAALSAGEEQISAHITNYQAVLAQCYDLLVRRLEGFIDHVEHLVIVPHGPLHYLPFQALHDGERYLLEARTISYLPASSFLSLQGESRVGVAGNALVVAFDHQGRIPRVLEEARQVGALADAKVLVGSDATKEGLLKAAPGHDIVHLAAHGELRVDSPLFSGIALADGWLTTFDLLGSRLDASLVTLSACQTGLGAIGGGDEILGLARACIAAGGRSLVTSLWSVEDEATSVLMLRFYESLLSGQGKAVALRTAQCSLIHGQDDARWRHPVYWAAFDLVGDYGLL